MACKIKTKIKTDANRGHVPASITVGLLGECLEYMEMEEKDGKVQNQKETHKATRCREAWHWSQTRLAPRVDRVVEDENGGRSSLPEPWPWQL